MEADPALQEKLSQPDDPAVFASLAADSAREAGLCLGAAEIAAAVNARQPIAAPPPGGWLPFRTRWRDGELHLDWTYLGRRRLQDPFFEGTMLGRASKPFNRLFGYTTPVDALGGWLAQHPGLPPAGFIFHMSRCGSTLVSQMLAAVTDNVVVSEAGPINDVVQANIVRPDLGETRQVEWLRWIVGALGQPRGGGERHYFVKLDSWHTRALPLFRAAFPAVPWVFLYRDPVEVLVSQLKRRGMHMVPGQIAPEALGLEAAATEAPVEHYSARVLTQICDGVLQAYAADTALLVNYTELPDAVWRRMLPHFKVPCSAGDRAAMMEAAGYDAKSPAQPFADDRAAKQRAITAAIRAAADGVLGCYDRLEALRLGG
jgi:hypothetical protein